MKQIAKAVQFFGDNLKSYIIVGLIVVLVPSFVLGQAFPQDRKNENKITEEVMPKVPQVAPPYGTVFMSNKPIACNDTPVIKNYIENINGMTPITIGTNKNQMGVITSLIQLYVNPLSDIFAIVEHFAIAKSCIIFQGHDFDIILSERFSHQPAEARRTSI